jgi:hypothetical protein
MTRPLPSPWAAGFRPSFAPRAQVGIDLNPIHIVEDVGGAVVDVVSTVGKGAAGAATYTADSIGDATSAVAHVITHPLEIPQDIASIITHPGQLVKQGAFVALATAGPVGLVYAWALDKSGVTDLVANAADAGAQIYVNWVVKPFCAIVKIVGGMPGLTPACLMVHLIADIARAIADRDLGALVDAFQVIVHFALDVGWNMNDAINSVMETLFRIVGKDVAKIFPNLDVLRDALNKVGLPGNDIVGRIIAAAPEVEKRAVSWAQHAAAQGIDTGFANVRKMVANKTGGSQVPISVVADESNGIDTILPIAPALLRRYATVINMTVQKPSTQENVSTVIYTANTALRALRDNQVDDFVRALSSVALKALINLQTMLTGPANIKQLFLARAERETTWWIMLLDSIGVRSALSSVGIYI